MFRIRQITPDAIPANRRLIEEVKQILRERIPVLPETEFETFEDRLRDPLSYRLHAILLVADDMRGKLLGCAYVSHAPDCGFCFLEYLATHRKSRGGVGGALYERVRELGRSLGVAGVFIECLTDNPAACSDAEVARQNAARLRFYERLGARPIVGTEYESPLVPTQKDMPLLVFDDLDSGRPLRRDAAREMVRVLLERKYGATCEESAVAEVIRSFRDDPVRLREPRVKAAANNRPPTAEKLIALVVNEEHDIHHVRERGYVEVPARVAAILKGIEPTGLFYRVKPRSFGEGPILAVHDAAMVGFLKKACASVPEGRSLYAEVFPARGRVPAPRSTSHAIGYYCTDAFTPIGPNVWKASVRAVDCTLTAVDAVLNGQLLAYALVRPPGHHAERGTFGGFCYLCHAAIAAQSLSPHGRVAILDIDYHHGNGQQDIFYDRADVLTVSIHADPAEKYPFFSGFADEVGEGAGRGCNVNIPLPLAIEAADYLAAIGKSLDEIRRFAPAFLVVSLGFDTGKGDPTGSWSLRPPDFGVIGRAIGGLGLPTVVVQEGGYRTATLGANAREFFVGLVGDRNA